MRLKFGVFITASILTFGCSKKEAAVPVADSAAENAKPAGPSQQDPLMAAGLEELNAKLKQQQYDAAVGSLVAMSQLPKSPEQEAQYRARLRETETALIKKAQSGDASAQQSVQMLGRMMTGR